jgi:hypothetical protein
MQRTIAYLLLLAVFSRAALHAQPVAEARNVLVVVDDLHLQFSNTPRLRELIRRILRLSIRDTDRVSLVSTGPSTINLPPTPYPAEILGALSGVIGGGLPPSAVLSAQQQPELASEVRNRATTAFFLVANAIDTIASSSPNPIAVFYFSDGYLDGITPEPRRLIQSALRGHASIYTFDLRTLTWETFNTVAKEEWEAYVQATQGSLHSLAIQTGGGTVITISELDALLSRLARK